MRYVYLVLGYEHDGECGYQVIHSIHDTDASAEAKRGKLTEQSERAKAYMRRVDFDTFDYDNQRAYDRLGRMRDRAGMQWSVVKRGVTP